MLPSAQHRAAISVRSRHYIVWGHRSAAGLTANSGETVVTCESEFCITYRARERSNARFRPARA